MLNAAAICDKGTLRGTNQDACCVQAAKTDRGPLTMAVVCDGVGGLAQGEVASSYVVHRLALWFKEELPALMASSCNDFDVVALDEAWDKILSDAHKRIRECGERVGEAMGTTFTGVIAHNGSFMAAQVGDSRLYLRNASDLCLLTDDQTVAAQLVEAGELNASDLPAHPGCHVILQAIGVGSTMRPVFTTGTYEPDDHFILCTDGVYGHLSDDGLRTCLKALDNPGECSIEDVCRKVVQDALQAGSSDNLTVACVRGDPLHGGEPGTVMVEGVCPW